jgi:hypothetical protein
VDNNVLYKLDPIADNPKYEGFGFVRNESIRGKGLLISDFWPDDVKTKGRAWTVTRMGALWTPQPVAGRVHSFNDYPSVGFMIPAFSRRAVDVLREFLEPNGELLPLSSTVGEYYAYNITTVVDILDHDKSQIEWPKDQRLIPIDIMHYECFANRMAGLSIFRLVEKPTSTFVTQPFVDRVHQLDLQGFHFIKLWPLPPGVSWRDEDRKNRRNEEQVKIKRGATPVKGNTVVLLLPIAKAKPSKAEKDRLTKVMDDIDALLHDPAGKTDAPYHGSLEGDDVFEGGMRLFLSCPDADALVEKLYPWLKALSRKTHVKVLKRYGEYVNVNCREEWVELN